MEPSEYWVDFLVRGTLQTLQTLTGLTWMKGWAFLCSCRVDAGFSGGLSSWRSGWRHLSFLPAGFPPLLVLVWKEPESWCWCEEDAVWVVLYPLSQAHLSQMLMMFELDGFPGTDVCSPNLIVWFISRWSSEFKVILTTAGLSRQPWLVRSGAGTPPAF